MRYSILVIGAFVSGCDILGVTTKCTAVGVPALSVGAVDSTTAAVLMTNQIRISASEGGYSDSRTLAQMTPDDRVSLALERQGTYKVDIVANGYHEWSRQGIRVDRTDDGCHVKTVDIVGRLRRL